MLTKFGSGSGILPWRHVASRALESSVHDTDRVGESWVLKAYCRARYESHKETLGSGIDLVCESSESIPRRGALQQMCSCLFLMGHSGICGQFRVIGHSSDALLPLLGITVPKVRRTQQLSASPAPLLLKACRDAQVRVQKGGFPFGCSCPSLMLSVNPCHVRIGPNTYLSASAAGSECGICSSVVHVGCLLLGCLCLAKQNDPCRPTDFQSPISKQ